MNENVIKYVEEISSIGNYNRPSDESYYVYLLPKTSDFPTSLIIEGKSTFNNEALNIPFNTNTWNPMLIQSLNVTQDILDKYSVFIGLSYIRI